MVRRFIENLVKCSRIRRHLPKEFGGRPIWVSPDARLRYLMPGAKGFDGELLSYSKHLNRGNTVFDIGANCGEFTLAAAHIVGDTGKVVAVEADPFLTGLLLRTCAEPRNRDAHIDVVNAACADRSAIVSFQVAARGRSSNALAGFGSTQMGGVRQEIKVKSVTVDEMSETWRPPDFIKIDVEGAEILVLRGAVNTLRNYRPVLVIEVSNQADTVATFLREQGYALYDAAEGDKGRPINKCAFNTLAIPKERGLTR